MTVDEAKTLLEQLNRGYNGPYSVEERAIIERLYANVLGKPIRGCRCPDKWHDAVIEALVYIKKNGKMKEKSNYILRAGVVLQIEGSSKVYTNDNLTDDVAAAFLKEHPQAVGRFEVIPKAKNTGEKPSKTDASVRLAEAEARIATLEAENAALKARMEAEAASGEEASAGLEGTETAEKAPEEAEANGTAVGPTKSGRGRKASSAKK